MMLSDCPHRRSYVGLNAEPLMACGLAARILGLSGEAMVPVAEPACAQCARLSVPTTARPNAVVASLVYNAARVTMTRSKPSAGEEQRMQSWQAQRYVLPALAGAKLRSRSLLGLMKDHLTLWRRKNPERSDFADARGTAVTRPHRAKRQRAAGPARVGLIGFNTASGLGYLARDLAKYGIADRWLIVPHPQFASLPVPAAACQIDRASRRMSSRAAARWLADLDWLLMPEINYLPQLSRLARRQGTKLALIPMWECCSPSMPWLRQVDLLLCPTRHSFEMFSSWKSRFGFTWEVRLISWPVSATRFVYRQRRRCERLLFVNGNGGPRACRIDGTILPLRRKGLDIVLQAARLTPEIHWIVCSQRREIGRVPSNVEVKPPMADNALLYAEGDVCVQPSLWEGLGLQLLECQAAGLPLITTAAAPMNEHRPWRVIPSRRQQLAHLYDGQPILVPIIDPQAVAQLAREVHGADLREPSAKARQFIENEHNWAAAVPALREIFDSLL